MTRNAQRKTKRSTRKNIPEFKSREEEAKFWDTHSLADYWDEAEPVRVRFGKNLSQGITIRFDPESLFRLRQHARQKGIGPATLARMWILERLGQDYKSTH